MNDGEIEKNEINLDGNDQPEAVNIAQKAKGPERGIRLTGILNSGRPGKAARAIPQSMVAENTK